MNLYHVLFAEFEDIAIFAKNDDEAQRLVDKYLLIHLGTSRRYQISHPIDLLHVSRTEFYQLQGALAKNVHGLGVYDSTNGWNILPLSQHTLRPKTEVGSGHVVTLIISRPNRVRRMVDYHA